MRGASKHRGGPEPGQSRLLVLDWRNGSRCVFVGADLTGKMIRYTLLTRPGRGAALIQAAAYRPAAQNVAVRDKYYQEYKTLHDYRGEYD